ncbi:GSCFA domain-containing protein [Algoriphagus confluentis]|uniref:GSCFA domain-containing protein n=1 Tax=Algoriphagus confluentis TaxID=1697556 RepID=A0ABQ6PUJ7_9BACT|nr:GSCFA domain-containing protein [Algoriphagus confluentis]
MRWSLDFPIPDSPFPITHQSKILSLGSCFAQVIGTKMQESKMNVLVNPFGTIFHPKILSQLLDYALFQDPIAESGILEREGLFFHYSAHSDLVGKSKEELSQLWKEKIEQTHYYLSSGTHLILTFGTAWIYEHHEFGAVANCHKQPQKLFEKRLSKLESMLFDLDTTLGNFSRVFPNLKIILTVSPVRHIKDGIAENQLSKSLLRVLCHELEKRFPSVHYFPAYEIMIDELRDYRFYKSDLIHPSEEAENYIWEKFSDSFFDSETRQKNIEIQKIRQELAHRPLNPDSISHQNFLRILLAKLERLNGEFDFSKELKSITEKLNPPSPL